jgi:hypothetical protein
VRDGWKMDDRPDHGCRDAPMGGASSPPAGAGARFPAAVRFSAVGRRLAGPRDAAPPDAGGEPRRRCRTANGAPLAYSPPKSTARSEPAPATSRQGRETPGRRLQPGPSVWRTPPRADAAARRIEPAWPEVPQCPRKPGHHPLVAEILPPGRECRQACRLHKVLGLLARAAVATGERQEPVIRRSAARHFVAPPRGRRFVWLSELERTRDGRREQGQFTVSSLRRYPFNRPQPQAGVHRPWSGLARSSPRRYTARHPSNERARRAAVMSPRFLAGAPGARLRECDERPRADHRHRAGK